MDEKKRGAGDTRDDAKKAWRVADGEDLGDMAANLGRDARSNVANAGEDIQDEAHQAGNHIEDDVHRAGRDPADVQPSDLPR